MTKRIMAIVIMLVVVGLLSVPVAQGDLSLTIDILTPDEFKFTLSGTFDADVIGDQRDWLAVKNDWSNNFGVNTDWLDDSLGFGKIHKAPWKVIENTILIGGLVPQQSNVAADGRTWGDSIYFRYLDGNIPAGTTVSGSVHVQGIGLFDDSIMNLELLSGYDNDVADWVRLEATTKSCPWDLDDSGSVGTSDLLELFAQWGTAGSADFDESGTVGTADLLILFANWGPCP